MESFATAYPLVYFDGDQKYNKGHVGVHSLLAYRRFQAMVAQLTGIPPNQQSTVFVCRRTKRQRLPVNENTNFNIILNQHNPNREKDCHFLVSVKKSKRDRKGGKGGGGGGGWKRNADAEFMQEDYDESGSSRGDVSPTDEWPGLEEKAKRGRGKPEKTILRRDPSSSSRFQAAMGLNIPGGNSGSFEDWPSLSSKHPSNDSFEEWQSRSSKLPVNPSNDNFDDWQRRYSKLPVNDTFEEWRFQSTKLPSNPLQQDENSLMGRYYNFNTARGITPGYYSQGNLYVQDRMLQNSMGLYNKSGFSSVVPPGVFSGLNSLQRASFGGGGMNLPQTQGQYILPDVLQDIYQGQMTGAGFNFDYNSRVCEKCWLTREKPVPFHFCVNDEVTLGFKGPSPAGPIERPVKAYAFTSIF
ncbi:hypothetical protein KI387_019111 [Taxus chinensis]|uniref:DUF7138 domain-containing protein n=1 Tax=Taxus chinensis TaxID=29808 RepID=A0AA38G7I8_TAXCH|nr:hypothetical protein KI387_019111 [Taxus chinensis]